MPASPLPAASKLVTSCRRHHHNNSDKKRKKTKSVWQRCRRLDGSRVETPVLPNSILLGDSRGLCALCTLCTPGGATSRGNRLGCLWRRGAAAVTGASGLLPWLDQH